MTGLDRATHHAGYWPSPWPVECGGNRRQKAHSGGLHAAHRRAAVSLRNNGRWNVMAVRRDAHEWYLGGTMAAFAGPPPFGWVERIDLPSLEGRALSPELPCGEHVWCGAILVHANGDLYCVNGNYLHRLDHASLEVVSHTRLPADRSHNGLLALSDGTLVTKDLRLESQGGTTLTRLDAQTLEVIATLTLPEGSMGRIAADVDAQGDRVLIPGTEHVWSVRCAAAGLEVEEWRPRYRRPDDPWGLAWDACVSDGACWLMDCGDVESVRRIHTVLPTGRYPQGGVPRLSWRLPSPRAGAQKLLRLDLADPDDVRAIEPFSTPGGGIIAPPVHVPEHDMAIAWDSINGGLAGVRDDGELSVAWTLDVRASMQPVVFPDTGELVINDFTERGEDHLVVVDIATGALLDRVPTGSNIANGMFLSADGEGGVIYCTTAFVAHVRWS
ncbi:MAG: hypothetical protein AAF513_11155 [Pseudomonadota bacterium]